MILTKVDSPNTRVFKNVIENKEMRSLLLDNRIIR